MRILITILLLVYVSHARAQTSCASIWEMSKQSAGSGERFEYLGSYIKSGCTDSLAECFLSRGLLFNELYDTLQANKDFRRAVELKPTLSEGWYQLARSIYLKNNSDLTSLSYMDYAIKNEPQNWKFLMLRGDIRIARRDFEGGVIDFENGIKFINSSKVIDNEALMLAYHALGGTQIDLSQSQTRQEDKTRSLLGAIGNLQKALSIDSLFDSPYFLLGNAYFYLNKYDESIHAFEKCLSLNPAYPSIKINLAIAYRDAGKYYGEQKNDIPRALLYLGKSYDLNKNDEETVRLLGVANGISGNHEMAVEWFLKATEINPKNATSWWNISIAYFVIGNKKKMKSSRKKALEIDPDIEKKMNGQKDTNE